MSLHVNNCSLCKKFFHISSRTCVGYIYHVDCDTKENLLVAVEREYCTKCK